MKKYGYELEFISQIRRDGSGTDPVGEKLLEIMQDEVFEVTCLSLTEKTFIASEFNSFVVKIKDMKNWHPMLNHRCAHNIIPTTHKK